MNILKKIIIKTIIEIKETISKIKKHIYKYKEENADLVESQKPIFKNWLEELCLGNEQLLKTYYKNIKTLKTRHCTLTDCPAEYQKTTNTLYCNKEEKLRVETIHHELLHMASSKGKNLGFDTANRTGVGINEGFTNLLINDKIGSYKNLVFCAEIIDQVIGRNKMLKMYFNADLKCLIKELNKYFNNESETIEFIKKIDNIYYSKDYSLKDNNKNNMDIFLTLFTIKKKCENNKKSDLEILDEMFKITPEDFFKHNIPMYQNF